MGKLIIFIAKSIIVLLIGILLIKSKFKLVVLLYSNNSNSYSNSC